MNSAAEHKARLRRALRRARGALVPAQRRAKSQRAALHLLHSPCLRRAKSIAVYLGMGNELDTSALIAWLHRLNRRVLVPVVDGGQTRSMRMLPLRRGAVLRARRYGIREPVRRLRPARRERIEVVVLPLIGFDARGLRLGSGGGYYDRWLAAQKPRPYCIGLGYALQEVAALPAEPWDQGLDAVCTERGLRYFSRHR